MRTRHLPHIYHSGRRHSIYPWTRDGNDSDSNIDLDSDMEIVEEEVEDTDDVFEKVEPPLPDDSIQE